MKLDQLTSQLKSGWTVASSLAAFIITIAAQLLSSPPSLWREAGQQPSVALFVVTVLVAATLCSLSAGKKPGERMPLWLSAGLALLVTMLYFVLSAQFSCPFADGRMTIGWEYLPAANDYVSKNPDIGCSLLIADFTGDTDKLWPRSQILIRWSILFAIYVTAVTLVAATVIRVMQLLRN